ncbi:MAG: hypothetical protein WBA10_03350 [Elainellaceae cyanobacterium]
MTFHILNWGMGVESTAILLLWIFYPDTRPFTNWNQLIIIVAQTGDEFPETQYLCETYILPLLRELGIRLVQVAKTGLAKADGYTLLADTRKPCEVFIEGDYKLSDNMLINGWVPRVSRPHICAIRWKGEVLDALVGDLIAAICLSMDVLALLCRLERSRFGWQYALWLLAARDDIQIGPYLGYNSDETKRVKDCQDYGCHGSTFLYPLVERGMNREACYDLIQQTIGVRWRKSCCRFCPFPRREVAIAHYQGDPQSAAFALWCEYNALAMNSRMRLFERYSVRDICREAGLEEAVAQFEQRCADSLWAVYYVRRIYRHVGNPARPRVDAARKVETLATGTQAEMLAWLEELAEVKALLLSFDSHYRVYSHIRDEENKAYPALEGFWVAAPAVIRDNPDISPRGRSWG